MEVHNHGSEEREPIRKTSNREMRLRQETLPLVRSTIKLFGTQAGLAEFLGCRAFHVRNVALGMTVFRPREAQMLEKVTRGKVTFRQLRPDIFFTAAEIEADVEEGGERFDDYCNKKRKKLPSLAKVMGNE